MDQIQSPEINPCTCSQLIYNKGAKNTQQVQDKSLLNDVGNTGRPHAKEKNSANYLTPYTKISSKWIRGLNVKLETVKLLEENIDSKVLAMIF